MQDSNLMQWTFEFNPLLSCIYQDRSGVKINHNFLYKNVFIHTVIFSNDFILARIVVDSEPIPGTLGVIHARWGVNSSHGTVHTHSHSHSTPTCNLTLSFHLPACFWTVRGNQKEPIYMNTQRTCKTSRWQSSGSYQLPWSCEEMMLPAVLLLCLSFRQWNIFYCFGSMLQALN